MSEDHATTQEQSFRAMYAAEPKKKRDNELRSQTQQQHVEGLGIVLISTTATTVLQVIVLLFFVMHRSRQGVDVSLKNS
jgi:hypothetical protein